MNLIVFVFVFRKCSCKRSKGRFIHFWVCSGHFSQILIWILNFLEYSED